LKDNLEQKFYSWDTTTLPDGAYYLKIVATDAPSNPPAVARKTERESERFEVDNTPPVIEGLQVGPASGKMIGGHPASFTARDASMAIERAQYSLDGGEWILLAPDETVSDALVEHYNIGLPSVPPGEHTIAVRAYDRFENVGSAKTTFTVPAAKP
jgi:flavin-binding protein dodecin